MRRRGFLRGHAFSECPLKSASFRYFLAETRKEHYRTFSVAERYDIMVNVNKKAVLCPSELVQLYNMHKIAHGFL